jgi:hypothetical protein
MQVFLSWSGVTSHKFACCLREWLPNVIQSLVPYVSSEDIDKGSRWSTDIAKELEESRYGIICVTKDNIFAPWVNFEAGALSKIIDKSFVTPFLFDLQRSDVHGPLLQFQSTILEEDDVLKLLKSINNRNTDNERLKEEKLLKAFNVWWPKLDLEIKSIVPSNEEGNEQPTRLEDKSSAILEELLNLARNQQRIISDPESLLPPEYLLSTLQSMKRFSTVDVHLVVAIERCMEDFALNLQGY